MRRRTKAPFAGSTRGRNLLALTAAIVVAVCFNVATATAVAPTVTLDAPGAPSYTSVPVSGTVDPKDHDTFYAFEVSTDGSGWSGFTYLGPLAANSGSQAVSSEITGLKPNTEYQLRLVANNFEDPEVISAGPNPTFKTKALPNPSVAIKPVTAITDRTAHFSGTIDPEAPAGNPAASNVTFRFECTPACPGIEHITPENGVGGGFIEADSESHEVSADVSGLEPNREYTVTLIAENANGPTSSSTIPFNTESPGPSVITIPAFAIVGGTKAMLGGRVRPENDPTKYWFEYGEGDSYGTSIPATEDGDAGNGENFVFVEEEIAGLQPGGTYHFRVVAENTFGTTEGEDLTFTTPTGDLGSPLGKLQLPDSRTWEMVSPPDKLGYDVGKVHAYASKSGDAVMFKSQGSFGDQATSKAGSGMEYVSRRGTDRWETHGIAATGGNFYGGAGYIFYDEELTEGILLHNDVPGEALDPEFVTPDTGSPQNLALYRRPLLPLGGYKKLPEQFIVPAVGDLRHGLVLSAEKLTQDSPCNGGSERCLYELNGSTLRLASLLPGDVPSPIGSAFDSFIKPLVGITEDGSAIWFYRPDDSRLYLRVEGKETVQLDESQRTIPPTWAADSMTVKAAESNGEKLLLEGSEQLVDADEDNSNDLYLWNGGKPAGDRLILLSAGDVANARYLHLVGVSDDFNTIYFSTENHILSGEVNTPGGNIYNWNANGGNGTLTHMVTASDADLITYGGEQFDAPEIARAHSSPDGRYEAIVSSDRLTAYDNAGQSEVYLFDQATGRLTCASCDPRNRPAKSAARFNAISPSEAIFSVNHRLRSVSPEGRVFFESEEGLVPRDSNGYIDVYEYTGGLPHLISTGTDGQESRFLDAGRDGNDIFFVTAERLSGWDFDDNYDVYDARVDGGLPEPPPPVLGCEGDACQPPPTPPNDPTPSSMNFNGAGNFKQSSHKKCKKGKKGKRCRKQHKSKTTKKNG